MEKESQLNPNFWENKETNNFDKGYGLTQWTLATKYLNWISKRNGEKDDIDWQLNRLIFEVQADYLKEKGYDDKEVLLADQWIDSHHLNPISFYEFTVSEDKTPEDFAEYFLRCYENPANIESEVQLRRNLTNKWKRLVEETLEG